MNPRGRSCSEPRLDHCIPAWATDETLSLKNKKNEEMSQEKVKCKNIFEAKEENLSVSAERLVKIVKN